ncbi:hypothetical protein C492_04555 [Natronococcus jeotgali DSM 18795]|uniref:DUF4397 domain-containing protein n=1 Tax=Natronococcus jeotgali DSM 18795 TaxID=1227498 RepID=L9XVX3_9EURY|nr:hypothetical protein C492_04555 [Natronococcus jeotgali DSM 18795]
MSIASGAVFAQGEHADDERPADDDAATDSDDTAAAVRIAHFSPDAPNVDVLVDGEQVLADVSYGTISPYLELEPGTYTVAIAAADDPETVAFEGEVDVGEGLYTVAAIGELGAETFRPEVLVDADPLPEDAADESAFVRVAHFSPDAPAVDVYADDAPLVEDVSFGDVSDYLAVPAGEYALSIRPAGEETEVASFDVSLESETVYTGYAIGYLEPPEGVTDRDFTVELAVDGPEEDQPPADAPGDGNGESEPADGGEADDQKGAAEEQKRAANDTKQTAGATTDDC